MKTLKNWFRATDDSSGEPQTPTGASDVPADYADSGRPDDHDEDTSYNWQTLDASSSSIFDSPDTHRVRVLNAARVRPANDDNPGYDPYDTGSFNAKSES